MMTIRTVPKVEVITAAEKQATMSQKFNVLVPNHVSNIQQDNLPIVEEIVIVVNVAAVGVDDDAVVDRKVSKAMLEELDLKVCLA